VIVVLDACVLYPPSLRDLLLTLAALDAFDIRSTEEILDEVTRNVIRNHPDLDADTFVEHTVGSMERAFPDASVPVPADLIESLDNDPKDRHVAAAAIAGRAQAIVTLNGSDFQSRVLREASISVVTPGDLVAGVLDVDPGVVSTAVQAMSERWTNPPRSVSEICELLTVHPTMAAPMAMLRRHLEPE
jgi:predicted nucleic acid-binding protein